jgi:hypothetical protein
VDGVRLLPWIATNRELGRRSFYTNGCDMCKTQTTYDQRRSFLCGWIPRHDWMPEERLQRNACVVPGSPIVKPQVCPAYAVALPKAQAAARAWMWWEKGQLAMRYPDASEDLMTMVELFAQERQAAESYYLKEKQRESK